MVHDITRKEPPENLSARLRGVLRRAVRIFKASPEPPLSDAARELNTIRLFLVSGNMGDILPALRDSTENVGRVASLLQEHECALPAAWCLLSAAREGVSIEPAVAALERAGNSDRNLRSIASRALLAHHVNRRDSAKALAVLDSPDPFVFEDCFDLLRRLAAVPDRFTVSLLAGLVGDVRRHLRNPAVTALADAAAMGGKQARDVIKEELEAVRSSQHSNPLSERFVTLVSDAIVRAGDGS